MAEAPKITLASLDAMEVDDLKLLKRAVSFTLALKEGVKPKKPKK